MDTSSQEVVEYAFGVLVTTVTQFYQGLDKEDVLKLINDTYEMTLQDRTSAKIVENIEVIRSKVNQNTIIRAYTGVSFTNLLAVFSPN